MRQFILSLFINFVLAIFIYPDPLKEYSGFWNGFIIGDLHGWLVVPNFVISLFDNTRLIKATNYSGLYNFSWWFSIITYIAYLYFTLFTMNELRDRKEFKKKSVKRRDEGNNSAYICPNCDTQITSIICGKCNDQFDAVTCSDCGNTRPLSDICPYCNKDNEIIKCNCGESIVGFTCPNCNIFIQV